jgi:hypothetical protein
MKNKITEKLKHIGRGYELDKLPPALLKAVVDAAILLLDAEIKKAEDRAIQKVVNEKFVARVIKATLEKRTPAKSKSSGND